MTPIKKENHAVKKNRPPIDWKKYFFELLVSITGISISFMVQNWREEGKGKVAMCGKSKIPFAIFFHSKNFR